MIQIEEITKKFTRIYHTVDDIKNFCLRIRVVDESSPEEEDIATFKWQQKRFSHQERERFQHAENCLTDLEKEYHQQILKETRRGRSSASSHSIIFSYIENDAYIPQVINFRRSRKNPAKPDDMQPNELQGIINRNKTNKLNLIADEQDATVEDNNYFQLDFKNPVLSSATDDFKYFYIMADFGEYYNSTWIPAEYILCTLKYSLKTNMFESKPDFTTFSGYTIKVTSDETKTYNYFIENASSIDVISRKNIGENKKNIFETNSLNIKLKDLTWNVAKDTTYVHVVLEILTGWNFENNNVFVRYWLVLNDWKLKNEEEEKAMGVTIASTSFGKDNRLHFGFPVEWHLIGDNYMKKDPVVHFELISKDTWSRFRSEGMTHLPLAVGLPGRRIAQLPCARTTSSGVVNELRRFFIGDCSNYQALIQPTENVNRMATTTISSGVLEVSVSILHVKKDGVEGAEGSNNFESFANLREMRMRDKLRDPQLTKTVEEAVEAFKRAREAMLEAREAAIMQN